MRDIHQFASGICVDDRLLCTFSRGGAKRARFWKSRGMGRLPSILFGGEERARRCGCDSQKKRASIKLALSGCEEADYFSPNLKSIGVESFSVMR